MELKVALRPTGNGFAFRIPPALVESKVFEALGDYVISIVDEKKGEFLLKRLDKPQKVRDFGVEPPQVQFWTTFENLAGLVA